MCQQKSDIKERSTGRLYLFDKIPLWKVTYTEKERLTLLLLQSYSYYK